MDSVYDGTQRPSPQRTDVGNTAVPRCHPAGPSAAPSQGKPALSQDLWRRREVTKGTRGEGQAPKASGVSEPPQLHTSVLGGAEEGLVEALRQRFPSVSLLTCILFNFLRKTARLLAQDGRPQPNPRSKPPRPTKAGPTRGGGRLHSQGEPVLNRVDPVEAPPVEGSVHGVIGDPGQRLQGAGSKQRPRPRKRGQ